jgi:chromosome partitioning protein
MGAGPVTLIDTDPQGSLSKWWNARAAQSPQFAKVGAFELQSALTHLERTGTQLAIIDTPPAISESIMQVIAHADLIIVPTRPSPHDLRAVGETVDMAEKFRKPLVFVVNGATARARITAEAAVALSQHGVVAPVTLHHRVDFAASMVDGRTVGEAAPKSASSKEIAELWVYLHDRIVRLPKRQETRPLPISYTPVSEQSTAAAPGRDSGVIIEARVVGEVPLADRFFYDGPERRSGADRREGPQRDSFFVGADYNTNVFGRRRNPYDTGDGE